MNSVATNHSFNGKLDLLRGGDDDAATWIWNRYGTALISLAQRHLDKLLRSKLDADDIANSAFKSFFVRFRKGQYELPNPESLWGLLAMIARRKCCQQQRRFRRQRRNVCREHAVERDGAAAVEFIDRVSTPSALLEMAETLRNVMRDFDRQQQTIVSMSMQGWSTTEISQHIGRTERAVQRALKQVKTRLQEMIAPPPVE